MQFKFLEDDELTKYGTLLNCNGEGYDVQNAELSMRLYDELTENKGYYNPEPVNYYQGA